MTKAQRIQNLLPNGKPRYVRVYDFDDGGWDRYTVVFTGHYTHKTGREHWYLGVSESGVTIQGSNPRQIDTDKWGFPPKIGSKNHLGRRIEFSAMPPDAQSAVIVQYKYLWDLEAKND